MKLSIITCAYNSAPYLQECLDSVVAQCLPRGTYEHIIVDGCSEDASRSILEDYKATHPDRSIVLEQRPPHGIYNAMNEGLKIAQGEYVLFLHADDYLVPDTLSSYLDCIKHTGDRDVYYAQFHAVDSSGTLLYTAPSRKLYQGWLHTLLLGFICYINQPAVIYKKSLHERFGYFNETLKIYADREFWIILSKHAIQALFYPVPVTNFRVHEGSTSNNKKNQKISQKEAGYIRKTYYSTGWGMLMKAINALYRAL